MNKTYKRFINEEIDKYVDKYKLESPNQIKKVIKELFFMNTDKLINSIGSVEADSKNQIASESWDWFIDTVTMSISEEPEKWIKNIKQVKLKILTYKYFTKNNMVDKNNLEMYLRTNIKPFFTALQNYTEMNDFRNKIFNLPVDILYSFTRYLFLLSPELAKSVKVTNAELRDNINNLISKRLEMADKISKISRGYQTTMDISEIKEYYDNGLFFEDNFINRAVSEYINKLLNHQEAMANLKDYLAGSSIKDLKNLVEKSPAFVQHLQALKTEQSQEYFTSKGEQIGKRFDNEIEVVKDKSFDGYVIDDESRLKEPNAKIQPAVAPWESTGVAGDVTSNGGGGSMSSSGSDFGDSIGSGFDMGPMGGDFAPAGSEGEIPGDENADNEIGVEDDGTPMPTDDQGFPEDFGTVEDNTEDNDKNDNTEENK